MISLILSLLLFIQIPTVAANFSLDAAHILTTTVKESSPCIFYQSVTVFFPDSAVQTFTCKESAEEILQSIGENPENYEIVHDYLSENGRDIIVVAVSRTRTLNWQKLNFPTEITYTKSLPHRKKVIDKRGETGLQGTISEIVTYSNGKKRTKTIARWLEREPKIEYVRVGTKYNLQQKVIGDVTVNYWGTLTVKATSYDHSCYGCNYTTATGAYLRKGIVAVDPKVIAMHTTMYIPGYGFGKAEDTGGKIKGNRIDLAYDDIRYGDWSKRWVTIYLVD